MWCECYQHYQRIVSIKLYQLPTSSPKVIKMSTSINRRQLEQSAGKVGWNFLVNTYRGKPSWAASIMAGGPGAASRWSRRFVVDGERSGGQLVKARIVPSGREPMGKYKKLERFLAPAINQPKAWKIKLFLSMVSSSRKQHLNCFHQEKFNVGQAGTSISGKYHLYISQNRTASYNIYKNSVVDILNATGSNPQVSDKVGCKQSEYFQNSLDFGWCMV